MCRNRAEMVSRLWRRWLDGEIRFDLRVSARGDTPLAVRR